MVWRALLTDAYTSDRRRTANDRAASAGQRYPLCAKAGRDSAIDALRLQVKRR